MDDKHSDFFAPSHRDLQDRFDTRGLADRLEAEDVMDYLGDWEREFVQSSAMFFLTTIDQTGQPTVSYKGGKPGFGHGPGQKFSSPDEFVEPLFQLVPELYLCFPGRFTEIPVR